MVEFLLGKEKSDIDSSETDRLQEQNRKVGVNYSHHVHGWSGEEEEGKGLLI
jgi:hypothetical protein